ncbi:MAG TPA: hypothetical protein VGE45_22590 [Chloroflexia bacterium]|jgi:hypothetical protein
MNNEKRAFLDMYVRELEALQARREDAQRRLEHAEREIKELDAALTSGRSFYSAISGNGVEDSLPDAVAVITTSTPNGRWANTPVTKAIEDILEGVPDWEHMERRQLYDMLLARLIEEQYPFPKQEYAYLSVNRALTHFLEKRNEAVHKQEL